MSTSSATLPRPTFSAVFPRDAEKAPTAPPRSPQLLERGAGFVKAHWKQLGLAALGLLGWRSARLRPLLRKAALMYALPAARKAFARARG